MRVGDGKGLREEYIVFFVRPLLPTAPILFLVPTGSYLAYANEHLSFDAEIMQPLAGQSPIVSQHDIELYETDRDLDPLRDRADFQKVLKELAEKEEAKV